MEKRVYNAGGTLTATTRYLYDGLLPIAEYDASNNLTDSYTRGLDLSGSLQGAGGIGGLLALTTNDTSYDYFTDGNGNVVDLTNLYGVTAAHYEYDPFGNLINSTGLLQQSYKWSSKENDGNGLVYYLYRFYNHSLGRWQNRDPMEEDGGINLYAFVIDSPEDDSDSWGLFRGNPQFLIPRTRLTDIPNIEAEKGWSVASRLLGEWFAGPQYIFQDKTTANEHVGQPYDDSTMTMDWVLKNNRAAADYNILARRDQYTGAALNNIQRIVEPYLKRHEKRFGDKWLSQGINPIERDLNYVVQAQSSRLDSLLREFDYAMNGSDDVDAALGNFNFRVLVGGKVCYDSSGAHVSVDTLGIYARVAFAFPPGYSQNLGYWAKFTNYVGYFSSGAPDQISVNALDFHAYKLSNPETGKDFWGFSDIKQSSLNPPAKYSDPKYTQ